MGKRCSLKQVVNILFLGCLFIYMGGYWLADHYQIVAAKKEMRRRLAKEDSQYETVHFVFTLTGGNPVEQSFYWEDDHEFHFMGSMYDVITQTVIGDKLYINCIEDKHEKKLVEQLVKHTSRQQDQKKTSQHSASLLISLVFIIPEEYVVSPYSYKPANSFSKYSLFFPNWNNDVLIPPPWI